ncbi:50S ribosomal protein L6 [Candidatus Falkowbacteria bacterium CG10_big_fil_rev_8_21_14_0_10_39_9]|uniref:Large ribosomal subunit protein uL6 n=1 Tax=Candidatus Falkowbacteria bacterium CG10_big_fil_rev_8_21_14_0_10_39_9 TaxID=1974566 RepID=A0A2M6WNP8_9BACT|nr:MAG: 50S ribosomal protein L6 [Candidatus Falkowbacteria bacterium CG10_big_fil_rev_8_21_14_0_10_39_9]
MSRVGKLPIKLNVNTQVKIEAGQIVVTGPKGELKQAIHPHVMVNITPEEVNVTIKDVSEKKQCALWGLYRNLINNMVIGVNEGFSKKLEIKGVGYKALATGNKLVMNLGYSHPIDFMLPAGIVAVVEGNFITISGIDKQLVGEKAAQLRRLRLPEPYKGKGVKYDTEVVRRKAGKTAASK